MKNLPRPDLSDRPHSLVVEREMHASPSAVYRAWTEEFDSWFATPGLIRMRADEGEPFVFLVEHEGQVSPHYGRFITLERDRLVELTWVTGRMGTEGAETVVTVEFEPGDYGRTHLRLTHAGFYDQAGVQRHDAAWEHHVLPHLDATLNAATADT